MTIGGQKVGYGGSAAAAGDWLHGLAGIRMRAGRPRSQCWSPPRIGVWGRLFAGMTGGGRG